MNEKRKNSRSVEKLDAPFFWTRESKTKKLRDDFKEQRKETEEI
jgi:hypothetical protein